MFVQTQKTSLRCSGWAGWVPRMEYPAYTSAGLSQACERALFQSGAGHVLPSVLETPLLFRSRKTSSWRVQAHYQKLCTGTSLFSFRSLPKIYGFGVEETKMTNSHASAVFCSVIGYLLFFCLYCSIFLLNTAFGIGEAGKRRTGRGKGQAAQPVTSKELLRKWLWNKGQVLWAA